MLAAFRTRGQIPFFFARAAAAMAAAAIRVVVVFNGAITNPGYQFRHASEITHCKPPRSLYTPSRFRSGGCLFLCFVLVLSINNRINAQNKT